MANTILRIIVVMIIMLSVIGISGCSSNKKNAKEAPRSQETPKGTALPPNSSTPPKAESISTEQNSELSNLQKRYNANVKMSSFTATVKEPLPGENYNVSVGAKKLSGTVIMPGEVFSLTGKIGPFTKSRGYIAGPTYSGSNLISTIGGGVCMIASVLYNAAILSDLGIVERHQHDMTVPYVPLGQDATISYGSRDLKVKNTTSSTILIWAESTGNTLKIDIYGSTNPSAITWKHDIKETSKFQTVYKKNANMRKGQQKVVTKGSNGFRVKSWVDIQPGNKTRQIGVDYYRPMPQVIEVGEK